MRLDSVAFRYRRKAPWVLKDVHLTLGPGTVTEVTGHNGAGKSTLLRLIGGLRAPRRGTITGRPGTVGYAPERFPTAQPFTVRAYLGHMAGVRGKRNAPAAIGFWAERLGFEHLLDVRLPELSKGSAQKVGLAQALLGDPGLLILDEPFAGLDAATRSALPALVAELASQGTTVVVSDHQRCLEGLPALERIAVAQGTATPLTAPRPAPGPLPGARPAPGPDQAPPEWTVLEVVVRADEADTIETKLRADGHDVRRRAR